MNLIQFQTFENTNNPSSQIFNEVNEVDLMDTPKMEPKVWSTMG